MIFSQLNNSDLPIHFFTIVLNGMPFIKYHINVFKKLPFPWKWHIIEGVAALKHDTAWSVDNGATIDSSLHNNGLSNDGTTDYINDIANEFPENIKVYRKNNGAFWDGKLEMVNAPLNSINEQVILFQIDVDEFWTINQIINLKNIYQNNPNKTASFHYCNYFVGNELIITSKNTYGNNTNYEWLRTWRYKPGDKWAAHEPPILSRLIDSQWIDLSKIDPFMHDITKYHGLEFQHFAYVLENQLLFKEFYYGYKDAKVKWKNLNSLQNFPVKLKEYFSWVNDEAVVDSCKKYNVNPIFRTNSDGTHEFNIIPKSEIQIKKILLIRTDAIGDAILSTAILKPLKEKFTNSIITVCCSDYLSQVFTNTKYVDNVIEFSKNKFKIDENYRQEILKKLIDNEFDLAINAVFSKEELTDYLTVFSGAKEKIGFYGNNDNIDENQRLKFNQFYNFIIHTTNKNCTELDYYKSLLNFFEIDLEIYPHLDLSIEQIKFADQFIKSNNLENKKLVALFPFAKHYHKEYHFFDEVIEKFKECTFLLLGGREKKESQIHISLKDSKNVIDLVGQTELPELIAIIASCNYYLGVDSAGAHLAAAFNIKSLIVLGGGHFGRFFPYSNYTRIVCNPIDCYNCNWNCSKQKVECITEINPLLISRSFNDLMSEEINKCKIYFDSKIRDAEKIISSLIVNQKANLIPIEIPKHEKQMTKNENIKISAIVSTYNSEKFIKGCLDDLINQTIYKKGLLEIIVVNSGSRENEDKVVKDYQSKYQNIKSIYTEEREGIYKAWNRGIKAAKGKYITNANTDDRHRVFALELMAEYLDNNDNIALVYADSIMTYKENADFNNYTCDGYLLRPDFSKEIMLTGCHMGPQPMWRRSVHEELGFFNENFSCAGDYEFWCRMALKYDFLHINKLLGLYFNNPNGIENSNSDLSVKETISIIETYSNHLPLLKKDYSNNIRLNQPAHIYPESKLAHKYLDGLKGLEIGASSHNPFGLNTRFVGIKDEIYDQEQKNLTGYSIPLDIEAYAHLLPVESETEDFLISSHVIEHCPDLIKTLVEWYRVIRKDGYLFMIVPKRDAAESDKDKPLTKWEQVFLNFKNDISQSEILKSNFGHAHYSIFEFNQLKEFVEKIFGDRLELIDQHESDDKIGNGFTLVYRKTKKLSEDIGWEIENHGEKILIKGQSLETNADDYSFVNIGIITYNRIEYTKQAINSIQKYTKYPHVISVVDNNSQDGTKEYLRELKEKEVIKNLVLLEENHGVSKASNLAWSFEPNAKHYLKYDNDIVIEKENWLHDMVDIIETIPQAGAVAYNFEPKSYAKSTINGKIVRIKSEGNLGGACILIPKRTKEILGVWNEDYGLYGEEDADYGYRISAKGLLNIYMEDEDIGKHLPGGKAAIIHPQTLKAFNEDESNYEKEYREWKDELRKRNVLEGNFYKTLNEYQTGKRNLFYESQYVKDYYKNENPLFSIIIPIFNQVEFTRNCIESLFRVNEKAAFEVIIVDNASKDESSNIVKKLAIHNNRLYYIKNEENLGFAKANNIGANAARGKYLLFLNNDTVVTNNWLTEILQTFINHTDAGIVGNKLIYPDDSIQHAGVFIANDKYSGLKLNPFHIGYKEEDKEEFNYESQCEAVTGACLAISKELFFKVNKFDESYWNGYEDIDLCFKVRMNGFNVYYQPKSKVIHYESKSGKERFSSEEKNYRILEKKWLNIIKPHWKISDKSELSLNDAASVIILTYNSSNTISNCLINAIKYLREDDEIIVVDNNSADATVENVKSIIKNNHKVRLIKNTQNLGFSAGTNVGIRMAKNPIIVLLNPDTVPTKDWLKNLTKYFQAESVQAVGPLSNYVAGLQKLELYHKVNSNNIDIEILSKELVEENKNIPIETKLLIGFCMAVRKEFFDRFGLLDENLFLGNDDLELSWRIKINGGKLLVATDVFVYHEGQQSFNTEKKSKTDQLVQESTDALYMKLVDHYGENEVPSPIEIWGIDWFKPQNALFNSSAKVSKSTQKFESRKSVKLILLSYNNQKLLKENIDSILKNTSQFELLIVDNNSDIETKKYLDSITSNNEQINVIYNENNVGFPGGINIGLKENNNEYVVILNNDIIVTNNWLNRLIEIAESNPKIGIIGPISNYVSGAQLDKSANYKSVEEMHKYAAKIAKENKGKLTEFPRVAFLCTLIKKEVIEKIGGLDERFSPGNFEDDDFCLRAQLAGYQTVIANDVFIHHYGSISFKANGNKAYDERIHKNRQIFIDKWGADPDEIWIKGKEIKNRNIQYPINKNLYVQSISRALIHSEENDLELAMIEYKNAITYFNEFDKKGFEALTLEDLYNAAGMMALNMGNLEEANELFKSLLEINETSDIACYGLAETFFQAEMYQEAKQMIEWAVNYNPENKNYISKLIQINQKLGLADDDFSLKEKTSIELLIKAEDFINNKDFNSAEVLLKKILEENPHNTDALNNLAFVFIMINRIEEAVLIINSVLEIDPQNEIAIENFKYIEENYLNE